MNITEFEGKSQGSKGLFEGIQFAKPPDKIINESGDGNSSDSKVAHKETAKERYILEMKKKGEEVDSEKIFDDLMKQMKIN